MLHVFYEVFAARILVVCNVLNNSFIYKHFVTSIFVLRGGADKSLFFSITWKSFNFFIL